jgi:hypothetical protein
MSTKEQLVECGPDACSNVAGAFWRRTWRRWLGLRELAAAGLLRQSTVADEHDGRAVRRDLVGGRARARCADRSIRQAEVR